VTPRDSNGNRRSDAFGPSEAEIQRPPRVAPYAAVGLSTTVRGISKRSDCWVNLRHLANMIHGTMFTTSIYFPIKVLALAEGAITGFTDEAFDMDHVVAAKELYLDIPGEETEFLGELAKQYGTYIIGQSKARWPEVMEDRFFNTAFIISPQGEVVHKYAKNHVFARERSCMPHDVYDRWVELYGDGIEAFYPVYKSPDVGNIGLMVCNDGMYPEAGRALAFNGAELIYRPSMAQPITGNGLWELQNRAHAMFNNCYVLAPNVGPYYLTPSFEHPFDVAGGMGHICDYQGNIISKSVDGADTVIAAIVDIEQLRQFREMSLFGNSMKDLRTEIFKHMYDEPIHPKNLWLEEEPWHHAETDEVYRGNIRRLQKRGVFTAPSEKFEGSRFTHPMPDPSLRDYDSMKRLFWEPYERMMPHLHEDAGLPSGVVSGVEESGEA
jgi:beta-ureidopropionase